MLKKAAGFQQKARCGHGASITSSSCFILICFQGLVVTFLRLASVCFTQKVLAKQAFLLLMVGGAVSEIAVKTRLLGLQAL